MNCCPVCSSTAVAGILEIAACPINTNILLKDRESAQKVQRADIALGFCYGCGHTFNTAFDPELVSYTDGYENSLYFSPTFRHYANELANRLVETFDLRGKTIVEVGSGDGRFLTQLCQAGANRGFGFDPSALPSAQSHDIKFIQDLYTEQYSHLSADFVCCRHVLEHLHKPCQMLGNIQAAVSANPHAGLYFEVPNIEFLIEGGSFWDFIYPHYSYFSASSLRRLFEQAGFRAAKAEGCFGGQFLGIEAWLAADTQARAPETDTSLVATLASSTAQLAETFHDTVRFWRNELSREQALGHKVAAWGGGAKCVTFLNLVANEGQIEYVADINPRKHALFVPGTGAQIVAPQFLIAYQPDLVVVLNPIYEEEVRCRLENLGLHSTRVRSLQTAVPAVA